MLERAVREQPIQPAPRPPAPLHRYARSLTAPLDFWLAPLRFQIRSHALLVLRQLQAYCNMFPYVKDQDRTRNVAHIR